MVTRWLGTPPASRAKTCTWFSGFLALAGSGEGVVALTFRSACADLKVGATFRAGLKPGAHHAYDLLLGEGLCRAPGDAGIGSPRAL